MSTLCFSLPIFLDMLPNVLCRTLFELLLDRPLPLGLPVVLGQPPASPCPLPKLRVVIPGTGPRRAIVVLKAKALMDRRPKVVDMTKLFSPPAKLILAVMYERGNRRRTDHSPPGPRYLSNTSNLVTLASTRKHGKHAGTRCEGASIFDHSTIRINNLNTTGPFPLQLPL